MQRSVFGLSVLGLLALSSACYIQNCPRGGKRAVLDRGTRPCMSCGLDDRGRCFGPGICCVEGLGCLMGSPESSKCVRENYLRTPCETGGESCGADGGSCAAPGVCCTAERCVMDPDCLEESEVTSSPAELLLRLFRVTARAQK